MDPIEKHLYEELEERRNESYENLKALEEEEEAEMSDKYEPMENQRPLSRSKNRSKISLNPN